MWPNACWFIVRPGRVWTVGDKQTAYRWLKRRHVREGIPVAPESDFVTVLHYGDGFDTFGIKVPLQRGDYF